MQEVARVTSIRLTNEDRRRIARLRRRGWGQNTTEVVREALSRSYDAISSPSGAARASEEPKRVNPPTEASA